MMGVRFCFCSVPAQGEEQFHFSLAMAADRADRAARGPPPTCTYTTTAPHGGAGDGASTAAPAPPAVLPAYATSAVSRDTTRQLDGGFSYEERWAEAGSYALGLLRTRYRRTVEDPGSAAESDTTAPWLASAELMSPAPPPTFAPAPRSRPCNWARTRSTGPPGAN